MSHEVVAKVVLDATLMSGAWIVYCFGVWIGMTRDQALILALIGVVCTVGSWIIL